MNIIALSDTHLRSSNPIARKDNIVKTQFKKLKFIFDYAVEHDCIILQAGDFLDKSRDWNLLVMLMNFFGKYKGVNFFCVLGQHDSYLYSRTRSTTLGILEQMGIISIIDSQTNWTIDDWNIYGSGWNESLPTVETQNNILITHRSIADTEVYPGQEYTHYEKFLKKNNKYDLIIVGDIHRSFHHKSSDGRYIVNTGPMLRAEATEYNIDHHTPHFWHFEFKEYDDESLTISSQLISIPHKSSDEVLSRLHIIERSNVDITEMSQLLDKVIDSKEKEISIQRIFTDESIKPKTRRLLREIYDNANNEKM